MHLAPQPTSVMRRKIGTRKRHHRESARILNAYMPPRKCDDIRKQLFQQSGQQWEEVSNKCYRGIPF